MRNCIRNWLIALLLIVCIAPCTGAFAYSDDTVGIENCPTEVQKILTEHFGGWQITGWVNPAGIRSSSACAFAAVHKGKENSFAAFGYKDGKWQYLWSNAAAVPQAEYGLALGECTEGGGSASFCMYEMTPSASETRWTQKDRGEPFLLTDFVVHDSTFDIVLENFSVHSGSITYRGWKTDDRAVTYRGVTQRDLKYFSWSAFPKTPELLKKKLTAPPEIPESAELSGQEIKFTGGKKYEVYSAPNKQSLRGGKGKALVSTNSWIQVFGTEEDWLLIQYSIDSGHYRFGYIPKSALPKKADVPELDFIYQPMTAGRSLEVTDDPLYSQSVLAELSQGAEVILLAVMGDWAYIQTYTDKQLRGFIPADALVPVNGFVSFSDDDGNIYELFEVRRMHTNAAHDVQAVTGVFTRIVEDEECYEPDRMIESETTCPLADDFRASMITDYSDEGFVYSEITDLYNWYIDAYIGRENYDGHELTYQDDMTDPEQSADFWFVTVRIRLNDRDEIEFMEQVHVPWA